MKYYIGIDGGGTKTHCVVTDENFSVKLEKTGGPSNFLILGAETVAETIFNLLDNCCSELKINFNELNSIVLGTTGAGRKNDAEQLEKAFKEFAASNLLEIKNFSVESDARIALEGAFSGGPGTILIAGTGSIMFGKDSSGNIYRVGGFGRYIGDEGSGYSIGRKGIMAVAKSFDGRGGKTMLTKLFEDNFGIATSEKLINEVYRNNFEIPSVAPLVLEASEKSDPAALKIIEEETDELVLHITAMAEKINEPVLNLSFIGSLINKNKFFSEMLIKKINNCGVDVLIKQPDHSPAVGAAILAKYIDNKS